MEGEGEDDEQRAQVGGDVLAAQATYSQVRVTVAMTVTVAMPAGLLHAHLPGAMLSIGRHFNVGHWRT